MCHVMGISYHGNVIARYRCIYVYTRWDVQPKMNQRDIPSGKLTQLWKITILNG